MRAAKTGPWRCQRPHRSGAAYGAWTGAQGGPREGAEAVMPAAHLREERRCQSTRECMITHGYNALNVRGDRGKCLRSDARRS